jgi:hypothetical protein
MRLYALAGMSNEASKKRRTGCLLPLGIYLVAVIVMYFLSVPSTVTDDFGGNTARIFSVATVSESEGGTDYGRTTLESIEERDEELPPQHFLLPEERITIVRGDVHHAVVLEDHGDWQLIEFKYNNTYMASSVYKAYADRVEPVSFKMHAHVGQTTMAFLLILPAWFVAWLITFLRNRRESA